MLRACAISASPFGHGRVSAFERVLELNPELRDKADSVVPCLRNSEIISARCQSILFIGPPGYDLIIVASLELLKKIYVKEC